MKLPHQKNDGALFEAISTIKTPQEARQFFEDLCTPAEIEAMSDRWRVVPFIQQDQPYRDIHDQTGISVTTVGRVARSLMHGTGGYTLILGRMLSEKKRIRS